jgi:hypothetical protein
LEPLLSNDYVKTPVSRQRFLTRINRLIGKRSARQLRDAAIEELLGEVFSVLSVPRCRKQDKCRVSLVMRQSSASNDVHTKAEKATALEAVTRQRLVKA